jgi:glycosyltransferase involved in cell wall biosynthesis
MSQLYNVSMQIAYCTNVRLPSERAHGHQVAAVCDALAALGHDVTIFCPYRKNTVREDYWTFHRADKRVKVQYLGTFDPIDHPFIPKIFQLHVLNRSLKRALRSQLSASSFQLSYTRTPALLPTLIASKIPTILELHTLPNRGRAAFVDHCNKCALVVCLTTPMKTELVSWGVDAQKVIVEGDAVDLEKFASMPAHTKSDAFTVGYAGSFKTMGHDKGVGLIIDAVHQLQSRGEKIAKKLAGGPAGVIQDPDYVGYLDQSQLLQMYASCDALIYPAPKSGHPYFLRDTSPLKIFEYMAAARPIIAADLPPVHDILDDSTAYFFEPGNAADLARVLEHIMDHRDEAEKKAQKARKTVENHTWENRMKRIMDALS